jgi:cellobiose phosphorylase
LPEYFDLEGRGMYSYLTGSASWFTFTLLTQTFGVRGQEGDLLIEPKLSAQLFKSTDKISVNRIFAGRKLKIIFINAKRLEAGQYQIFKVLLNSENLFIDKSRYLVFTREAIVSLPKEKLNIIEVFLG